MSAALIPLSRDEDACSFQTGVFNPWQTLPRARIAPRGECLQELGSEAMYG